MKYTFVHWDPANIVDQLPMPITSDIAAADSIYDVGQIIDEALNKAALNRIVVVIDKQ